MRMYHTAYITRTSILTSPKSVTDFQMSLCCVTWLAPFGELARCVENAIFIQFLDMDMVHQSNYRMILYGWCLEYFYHCNFSHGQCHFEIYPGMELKCAFAYRDQ